MTRPIVPLVIVSLATALLAGPTPAASHALTTAVPVPPVVSVAGDIACGTRVAAYNGGLGTASQCRQRYTAPLLAGSAQVWTLGDHVYPVATTSQLVTAYTPTWGQYASVTHPTPGDHDYGSIGGRDYFAYFDVPPYYSFDPAPGWHAISLDSEIDHTASSPQVSWLREDLAATTAPCVVAYWGAPRFTSSKRAPGDASFDPFWQALYAAGADLTLAGDDHHYERFAKVDPTGAVATDGIRQFVVGTGGRSLVDFPSVQPASRKRIESFGVLRLTLRPDGYDWRFVGESGTTLDAGSKPCR